LWKEELAKTHKKIAESLADPAEYPNLFPDLELALKAEKLYKEERSAPVSSLSYVDYRENLHRDLLDGKAYQINKTKTTLILETKNAGDLGEEEGDDQEEQQEEEEEQQQQQQQQQQKQPAQQPQQAPQSPAKPSVNGQQTPQAVASPSRATPGTPSTPVAPSPAATAVPQQQAAVDDLDDDLDAFVAADSGAGADDDEDLDELLG